MARKVRVEFEGAIYHVMCRGDRRENIFEDDADRARFLETLAEACQRTGWRIHAYVLMSNHYHWLLETPQANLVAGMRWFQSCFTVRYNVRHRKAGHLFQGRYKAVLVDAEAGEYFAAAADYIHLNPARAGLLGKRDALANYRWSSLPCYLASARQRPGWLEVSRVLGALGWRDRARDRRAYGERPEERAREGLGEEALRELRRGWVFGGEAFRDRVLDWMEKNRAGQGRKVRREETDDNHGERQAERIIREMLEAFGLEEAQLLGARKGDWRKRVIGQRVRQETSVSLRWLGARLKMGSEGHVSRITGNLADLADHPGRRSFERALQRNARKKD
jgi:REP element-mobilizing transposase RayT